MAEAIDGLVVVDKAAGWTSHDVVAKCRGIFGQKKIGHSGTLDPDATGVLLVGLGRVTRLLRFLTALPKSYTGEVVFGTATSTLDAAGDVTATYDMSPTPDEVQAAAASLTGDIEQVPPMVSAVKVGGKRLHELARAGKEVERAARPVHVSRFATEPTDDPLVYRIEVDCSSGTYIRTLAADLGELLEGGAHLRNLRRTAIGSFTVAEAAWLDALTVLPPAEALRDYPAVPLTDEQVTAVGHGKRIELPDRTLRLVDEHGELVAMAERGKAVVVLRPA